MVELSSSRAALKVTIMRPLPKTAVSRLQKDRLANKAALAAYTRTLTAVRMTTKMRQG